MNKIFNIIFLMSYPIFCQTGHLDFIFFDDLPSTRESYGIINFTEDFLHLLCEDDFIEDIFVEDTCLFDSNITTKTRIKTGIHIYSRRLSYIGYSFKGKVMLIGGKLNIVSYNKWVFYA